MQENRESWSSKFGFIMAASGAAVGIGNIWRFPYICGENGGGAFILTYLFCILLIGMPIMITEFILGRQARTGSGSAFNIILGKKTKLWTILGSLGVVIALVVSSYYSIISGWTLEFLYQTLADNFSQMNSAEIQKFFPAFLDNDGKQILWHSLFTILTTLILTGGITASIEKFSKIVMPILFLMVILLAVFSINIESPGFTNFFESESFKFIFNLNMDKFTNQSFYRALGQAAFTLSVASGIMIAYGSYISKEENLIETGLTIVLLDSLVALIAGFVIFPIIFSFNVDPSSGTELVFLSLPNLFNNIPLGYYFAIIFYSLLAFAALTSSISILEPFVTHIIDEFKIKRQKAAYMAGTISLLLGILWIKLSSLENSGTYGNVDNFISDLLIPIYGITICIFAGWLMDKKIFENQLADCSKLTIIFIKILIKYFCPLAIGIILIKTFI